MNRQTQLRAFTFICHRNTKVAPVLLHTVSHIISGAKACESCLSDLRCWVFSNTKNESVFPRGGIQHKEPRTGGIMSLLRMLQVWIAMVVLSAGVVVVPGVAASSTQTFTGKVSDAMCGAKHSEGNIAPADCVRACVQKGANYALVVGPKVYTLKTSDQAALDELNKLSWEQAKVTGTANGDTISVKSVTAAK
jgi:hypothetical protein